MASTLEVVGFSLYGRRSPRQSLVLEKLVVRRDTRWFLVSGIPDSRVDRALTRSMKVRF